MFLDIVGLLL